jgi:hypothetical protein
MKQVWLVVLFFFALTVLVDPIRAERQVLDGVPYIHQVMDMNTNVFHGYNACGPTSSFIVLVIYKNWTIGRFFKKSYFSFVIPAQAGIQD